ncbi:MAG: SAF domain-containing protein [Alphaproteobacteria bacterium]|nr:SAF domain-containing protein [Alphaproteobacteria bacterium]
MYLYRDLLARADAGNPIKVGLIGAGKFGTMFLSQVPTTPGLEVAAICDLDPEAAQRSCRVAGWGEERIAATRFSEDAAALISGAMADGIEIVVEATGDPLAGVVHASCAIAAGLPIIMVNVEADVLAGPILAKEAERAGVVYSMAYGDQPALICELVAWARSCGFEVVAAGKGTKYLPEYHAATPDTVWDHYGLTADEAQAAGMQSQMFNSFLDGTKSALEMAAVCNATGLAAPTDGLCFPPAGVDELAEVLRPQSVGGSLSRKGQVEVVSSLYRDGSTVARDLRWGVYVVVEAPSEYAAACFAQYGLTTDTTGRYAAIYKPVHLIGLELNISILSAALHGRPTGMTRKFKGDVVTVAKRDLAAGEMLDGEGGFTVWGKLIPAEMSVEMNGLPIGLAQNAPLKRAIAAGHPILWGDVDVDQSLPAVAARREMMAQMRPANAAE